MVKSTTYKGQPKPYGKSGHFYESRRHSLQAKGIRTGKFHPYYFQDTHQEKVIHGGWDKGNSYRYVLEGAGDIFRELTKPRPSKGYLFEKINRIEGQIKDEQTWVHQEDSFEYSYQHNKDRFGKMIDLWEKQPYQTETQKDAINLNIAMLKGDFIDAKMYIDKIKSRDTDKDNVPDIEDCEPFNPEKQGLLHEAQVQNARLYWWCRFMATPPTSLLSEKRWKRQLKSFPYSKDRDKDGVPDYFDQDVKGD
jgi:hypothetical protein